MCNGKQLYCLALVILEMVAQADHANFLYLLMYSIWIIQS